MPYTTLAITDPYPADYAGQRVRKVEFLDALIVRREWVAVKTRPDQDENADFIVAEPYRLRYWLDGDADERMRVIAVPRGMLTDLSSVPRFARWRISQVGPQLEASIVHDFLYLAWQDVPGREARRRDQRFADQILRAGMKDAKMNWVDRFFIYLAVRLFGWPTYQGRNHHRYYDFWSPAAPAAMAAE